MSETFTVRRVSAGYFQKEAPCEEAVDTGERKQVDRENIEAVYTVTFDTLEQLVAFVDKYDGVIIDAPQRDGRRSLMIYDGYAE